LLAELFLAELPLAEPFFAALFLAEERCAALLPVVFRADVLLADVFRAEVRFADVFFAALERPVFFADAEPAGGGGTFPPARRASERPIAIACLGFFTLRPLPDLSVPFLNAFISRSTSACAFAPYLAPPRLPDVLFLAALDVDRRRLLLALLFLVAAIQLLSEVLCFQCIVKRARRLGLRLARESIQRTAHLYSTEVHAYAATARRRRSRPCQLRLARH
jgi:hypothetical protein